MEWLRRLLTGPKKETLADKAARIASCSDEVIAAEARRLAPLLSEIMHEVGHALAPGMTTRDVASALEQRVRDHDLFPAMLGYNEFPAAAAISVNEQVVNGLPSLRRLADGDIVTIELSVASDRGYASQGWTFPVGAAQKPEARVLLSVGPAALESACAVAATDNRTGDIGAVIQGGIEAAGLSVIRDFVGYGMGRERIGQPSLPGLGKRGTGTRLKVGQVLHVHVIAKDGTHGIVIQDDGWGGVAADGRLSALFTAMVEVAPERGRLLSRLLDQPSLASRPSVATGNTFQ